MATRRVIKGVLGNFLGTYVSRYSDYNSYLLFGYLVGTLTELRINLLGQDTSEPHSPTGVAVLSAIARFEDQRRKAGLAATQIREAALTIRQLPGQVSGEIYGHSCPGFNVSFLAEAVMDNGKRYRQSKVEFIAPQEVMVRIGRGRSARPRKAGTALGGSCQTSETAPCPGTFGKLWRGIRSWLWGGS